MADNIFGGTNTQASGYVQDALNKPFSFSNTQAALNSGQLQQQAADTAYQSATRYLDPQFQRQQSGLENQLANQGITRGSEAYNNAMDAFNANKNTAYDQARSQAYTQGLSGANQALNTMFQQSALDVSRQNALTAADAAKQGGLYSIGGGLLGSPTGSAALGNILSGAGTGIGSVLGGLGGLFGSGSASAALPEWAAGITDPQTLAALGLASKAPSLLSGLGDTIGNVTSGISDAVGGLFGGW